MGLDISVYSRIQKIKEYTEENADLSFYEDSMYIHPGVLNEWTRRHWPQHCKLLEPGIYTYAVADGFRAGSYGGYGLWRAEMGLPLLRNFADNEGYLDSNACKELLKQMSESKPFQSALNSVMGDFFGLAKKWKRAAELGADGGVIVFE